MTEEMKNMETAGAENTVSDPAAELQTNRSLLREITLVPVR